MNLNASRMMVLNVQLINDWYDELHTKIVDTLEYF